MSTSDQVGGFLYDPDRDNDGDTDAGPPEPDTDRCPVCQWAEGHAPDCPNNPDTGAKESWR
jgi:hypothetical protein